MKRLKFAAVYDEGVNASIIFRYDGSHRDTYFSPSLFYHLTHCSNFLVTLKKKRAGICTPTAMGSEREELL